MKNKKILFMVVGFVTVFAMASLLPNFVFADSNYGLDSTAQSAGLPMSKDLSSVLGNIIGSALSMIAVLFFGLMIYGGITWMVARGKSENTQKALDTIIAAIIGIVIIMSAYAITNFVFSSVKAGAGGTTSGDTTSGGESTGGTGSVSCTTNNDCPSGQGMICSSGSCVDDPSTSFCYIDLSTECIESKSESDVDNCWSVEGNVDEKTYSDCIALVNNKQGGCVVTGCSNGLVCDTSNGQCVNYLSRECNGNIDCGGVSTLMCLQLSAGSEQKTCRPKNSGIEGSYCIYNDNDDRSNDYCALTLKCSSNSICTKREIGDYCDNNSFCSHIAGGYCNSSKDCAVLSPVGGDCNEDTDCGTNVCYDEDICIDPTQRGLGSECDRNKECSSGICIPATGKCS